MKNNLKSFCQWSLLGLILSLYMATAVKIEDEDLSLGYEVKKIISKWKNAQKNN